VVEDNPVNQQIACELLAGQGARVAVAGNGQEALDLLRSGAVVRRRADGHADAGDGRPGGHRAIRAEPRWPACR
jgi:CheY-like chemotaxis protein